VESMPGVRIEALVGGAPAKGDIVQLELFSARRALSLLRMRMAPDLMEDLLAADLERSDVEWRRWAAESDGEWKAADVEFVISGLSSRSFQDWWSRALDDLHGVMYPGYPEHYRFGWVPDPRGTDDTCLVVIEEVGHQPFRMYCSYGPEWAPAKPYPGFDALTIGVGRLLDGTEAVRFMNEIRETANGFVLKLGFYVGIAVPESVTEAHVEQQLVEWTRWIEMARECSGG